MFIFLFILTCLLFSPDVVFKLCTCDMFILLSDKKVFGGSAGFVPQTIFVLLLEEADDKETGAATSFRKKPKQIQEEIKKIFLRRGTTKKLVQRHLIKATGLLCRSAHCFQKAIVLARIFYCLGSF